MAAESEAQTTHVALHTELTSNLKCYGLPTTSRAYCPSAIDFTQFYQARARPGRAAPHPLRSGEHSRWLAWPLASPWRRDNEGPWAWERNSNGQQSSNSGPPTPPLPLAEDPNVIPRCTARPTGSAAALPRVTVRPSPARPPASLPPFPPPEGWGERRRPPFCSGGADLAPAQLQESCGLESCGKTEKSPQLRVEMDVGWFSRVKVSYAVSAGWISLFIHISCKALLWPSFFDTFHNKSFPVWKQKLQNLCF